MQTYSTNFLSISLKVRHNVTDIAVSTKVQKMFSVVLHTKFIIVKAIARDI